MTQSGGQAAGIQLQVGLDLAYFRNQLPKLGATAAGYQLPLNIKFDRKRIADEYRLLNRYISGKEFKVLINSNLKTEIDNANKLTAAIGRVQQAAQGMKGVLPVGTEALGLKKGKGAGQPGVNEIKALYEALAMAGVEGFGTGTKKTRAQMVTQIGAVAKDTIAGLLNGLDSQDAKVQAAAKSLGESLIASMKAVLGIASPSKKFEEIGKNVGEGFEKGALSSMDNAFDAMENKMRQRGKILDTIARGIFGMLGMDPAAMMQQARQQKAVPPRTPIAGLLPEYTSRGAREEIMRQLGAGGGGGGGPSDQGPGKLALSNEALGKRVSAILEEYFRVAEVQVRETFDPRELKRSLNIFAYVAQALRDAEARTRQARVEQKVDAFIKALELTMQTAEARLRIQAAQVRTVAAQQPLLPAGRVAGLLPGRPSQASVLELNNILAGAIREYFNAVAREIKPSATTQGRPLLGPGSTVAGLLPPAGGTTPRGAMRFNAVSTGAFLGQPSPMRAPSIPAASRPDLTGQSSRLASPLGAGYFAVGKGLQGIKQAYAGVKPFLDTKKLPLSGAMTELGGEFGTAIKQVLLYGTAYKALAFFTSLPGQAFEAAKGLATYRNQLKAVTSESQTFDQSLAFVDNLAQRFNVPLDSARQGFVKLYASMQPAGFGQEQIEGLFTGISKAAAAFGLSADKVDRVNYAFAQMASKGQIMSEELKGQLGDVLPGALGLFAQAAQMSIPEFSKAMEDGAFKGKAMTQVLDNVAILMNNKFGPAAQGAAKTLQGAVNQIQNNLTLMYESFGPIVDRFAAIFGPQINGLIKDVTATMKVLTGTFTAAGEGFATLSPRAQAFYAAIQSLTPPLQQAGAAIADLGSMFAALLPAMVQAIAAAISFASSPLGRGAIIASVAIGVLTASIKLLEVTGLKAAIKSVYLFIGGLLKIPAASGAARLALITLKLAITGLFIGAVLIGLDLLIGKVFNIGDAANDSEKDIRGMKKALDDMAGAQDFEGTSQAFLDASKKLATARAANAKALKELREARAKAQQSGGAAASQGADPTDELYAVNRAQKRADETYEEVLQAQRELQATQKSIANAAAVKSRQDKEAEDALQKIDLSGGDEADKIAEQNRLLAMADDRRKYEANLMKLNSEQAMQLGNMEFEHWKSLQNARFDYLEAGQNEWMQREIKFQRDLQNIEIRRIETIRRAQQETQKAEVEAAGAAYVSGSAGGQGGGGKGNQTLSVGSIKGLAQAAGFSDRDASIMAAIAMAESGGQSRALNDNPKTGDLSYGLWQVNMLGRMGPERRRQFGIASNEALYNPETNAAAAKKIKESQGFGAWSVYKSGAYKQYLPSAMAASAGTGTSRARTEAKQDYSADLQAKEAVNAKEREAYTLKLAQQQAQAEINALIREYVASIAPVEQQKLENSLLEDRIRLVREGKNENELENILQIIKVKRQEILATETANATIEENNQKVKDGTLSKADAVRLNAIEIQRINELTKATKEYIPELEKRIEREKQLRFEQAIKGIQDQLAIARSFTPDREMRTQIAQEGFVGEQAESIFQERKTLQGAQKLKEDMQGIASSIGDAFGTAFKGIITGSATAQEALAGMFQSIADSFADMVAQMIAEWIKMMILKGIEAIINPLAGLGNLGGGALSGATSAASTGLSFDPGGMASFSAPWTFANGGIAPGGFTAFANGGMVTGPTMGLVGEGRYNEAIVPLPDGKSIPVELSGGGSAAPTVIVNVDAKGSQVEGNEQNANQLGRVISAAVQTELIKQQRPGGLLAR